MEKILLIISILFLFIPISSYAETFTFNIESGDEVEEEIFLSSGQVDYSIFISGGDEKITLEIFGPKFYSFGSNLLESNYTNTIITDATTHFGNLGPKFISTEGFHVFVFYNSDNSEKTINLKLDVREYYLEEKIEEIEKEIEKEIEEEKFMCGSGTHEENGECVSNVQRGGCLIATAAYGSELAPQIQQLRELRDNKLLQTESGSIFMELFNDFYYSFSPTIADYERENPVFKEVVKITITPMISSLSILNNVDMESEVEILGYGISLILLNVGLYFGVPAIVVMEIRKRF